MDEIQRRNKQIFDSFKAHYRKDIKGSFLVETYKSVMKVVWPSLISDVASVSAEDAILGSRHEQLIEICRVIIGIHHSKCVYLTSEETNKKIRDPKYKEYVAKRAVENFLIRKYAADLFRNNTYNGGERYMYYPVPYGLFAMCVRVRQLSFDGT